jgi:fructose-specific component phosphotransferase system IIB-like protein
VAVLSAWEVAARRFEARPEVSVDIDLVNMIRRARGEPDLTLAEAEAKMADWIASGAYVDALARAGQPTQS